MKQVIPPEHKSRTLSSIIVVAFAALMLGLLIYFQSIWSAISTIMHTTTPFLLGFAFAFLELPLVRVAEKPLKKLFCRKREHPKLVRTLATLFSTLVLLLFFAAFLSILLPQIIDSVRGVVYMITNYVSSHNGELTQQFSQWLPETGLFSFDGERIAVEWADVLSEVANNVDVLLDSVMTVSTSIYKTIFNLFIGIITSFYLLMDKERLAAMMKKAGYAFMKKDSCELMIHWMRRASKIFSGFIAGKIIDSLIIGVLCYLGMLIFRFEYPLLISVIVGVTNVIPFFGPFIGAVPSILLLMLVNPFSALGFLVFIVILQQIDGNVIGPLILGDSVGISPLWIMISIVVGGGLFGFVGMLLGVPVFALLYGIVKASAELRLHRKGMATETTAYMAAVPVPDPYQED